MGFVCLLSTHAVKKILGIPQKTKNEEKRSGKGLRNTFQTHFSNCIQRTKLGLEMRIDFKKFYSDSRLNAGME